MGKFKITVRKGKEMHVNILRILYHHQLPYTAYEIAQKVGISYPTAKKYLNELAQNDSLVKTQKSKGKKSATTYYFDHDLTKRLQQQVNTLRTIDKIKKYPE
jgi:predicted transcriptional regulator